MSRNHTNLGKHSRNRRAAKSRKSRKKSQGAKSPTAKMSRGADLHLLFEESVQDVEGDI